MSQTTKFHKFTKPGTYNVEGWGHINGTALYVLDQDFESPVERLLANNAVGVIVNEFAQVVAEIHEDYLVGYERADMERQGRVLAALSEGCLVIHPEPRKDTELLQQFLRKPDIHPEMRALLEEFQRDYKMKRDLNNPSVAPANAKPASGNVNIHEVKTHDVKTQGAMAAVSRIK